jgi:hypothetical protein
VDNTSGRGLFMSHPLILYCVVRRDGNCFDVMAEAVAAMRKMFGDKYATVQQLEPGAETPQLRGSGPRTPQDPPQNPLEVL